MNFSKEDMETILIRINNYADQVLPERDPAKVPIRVQLDALKPEMEKLATEKFLTFAARRSFSANFSNL